MYSLDNVLQQRLDAFVGGERSESQLLQDLAGLCVTPNAAWETLALIDQYHRRGKLTAEVARVARHRIERRLFGVQEADDTSETTQPAPSARTANGFVAGSSTARTLRQMPHIAPAPLPNVVAAPAAKPITLPAVDLAPELAAARAELEGTRIELLQARRRLKHVRLRLQRLLRFGHRKRHELRQARRELGVVSMQAATYLERIGSLERSQSSLLLAADAPQTMADADMKRGRRLAQLQGAALLVLLLGAVSMPFYQYLRLSVTPAAPAPVVAQPEPLPPTPKPGVVGWSSDRYVVLPGRSSVELLVHRIDGVDGEASFEWWTEPAGARSGVDYIGVRANTVRIADGEQQAPLTVRILPNTDRRYTEMFYVLMGNAGGATLGQQRRATVFILPD